MRRLEARTPTRSRTWHEPARPARCGCLEAISPRFSRAYRCDPPARCAFISTRTDPWNSASGRRGSASIIRKTSRISRLRRMSLRDDGRPPTARPTRDPRLLAEWPPTRSAPPQKVYSGNEVGGGCINLAGETKLLLLTIDPDLCFARRKSWSTRGWRDRTATDKFDPTVSDVPLEPRAGWPWGRAESFGDLPPSSLVQACKRSAVVPMAIPRAASMEPRLVSRGNTMTGLINAQHTLASMEPRLVSRGNPRAAPAGAHEARASMEPRLVSRGNRRRLWMVSRRCLLQWSRGS